MLNLVKSNLLTSEFAYGTNTSAADLSLNDGYCVVAVVTVSTPAAKAFATSDVSAAANTITEVGHGFKTGLKGQVSTTTTLPAGLSAATDYFVIVVDADTYKLATNLVNAQAGTAIDITDQGTGTHTFTPTALAGGSVKLQGSLDGTTYVDIASSSNNITVTANFMWNVDKPYYQYVRAVYALTAGQLSVVTDVAMKKL